MRAGRRPGFLYPKNTLRLAAPPYKCSHPAPFIVPLQLPNFTVFRQLMRFFFPGLFSYRNPNPIHLDAFFARSLSLSFSGFRDICSDRSYLFPSSWFGSTLWRNRLVHPSRPLSVESGLALSSSSSFASFEGAMSVVASMADEAISPAKKFWLKAQKEAMLAKYTPFVVCLASGKLELDTFRQYIAQDVHFLRSFARAYEKAEEYADDDDAKAAISKLWRTSTQEMKLHNSVLQDWGVDPSKEIPPNPATVRYTNFLDATSAGKIEVGKGVGKIVTPFEKTKVAAYIVGAMVPCMRLYAFLGKELEPFLNLNGSAHPYSSWVKNYSPSTFEEAAVQIEELLDKLSVPLTGDELDVIQKLYHQAMKLEIDFFLAQPIVQPSVVPLSKLHDPKKRFFIVSDFDLTCTLLDSCTILAEISIKKEAAKSTDLSVADNPINQMSSSDLGNLWRDLSGQYIVEYEQCIEKLLAVEEAKTFAPDDLYNRLQKLSEFEKRANSRVILSGFLKGMNINDIKRAGEHLNFQDGCSVFFQKIVGSKERLHADIHILSYCWCEDLIRSAFTSGCIADVAIHSNDLEYNESISTGEIVRKIESPVDKLPAFRSILDQSSDAEHLSVYIGDSIGDLLCLLEADIGIVVGSSGSLRRVGKHFGITFIPLFQGLVQKQRELGSDGSLVWNAKSGILYTVSGWPEIQAFILGHEAF
ncbi:bifunctional TH2 protein, mitochondrial isoform X2 [Phalaenopsis equestris]|uniref:bifunctional TH2 protein, mitochondrial isoform X2 n=1 Tax=Phalaenopsis equestris TaxID=78828 RepID=UPI0009E1A932|nr:bifunctional TH2 protein, mitochondrial isoform X2 [Phalaenopsis equestris]